MSASTSPVFNLEPGKGREQFAVKTDVFEGPLELLIELVEKRKLLINDISLADVTDEYMKRVSDMQQASLPNTAQFVVLAATLLLIKSKSLLPVLELTDEEEESITDLETRLKEYQVFREAGQKLAVRFGVRPLYNPEYTPPREPIFLPDRYCHKSALATAMTRVLAQLPTTKPKPPNVAVKPTITLEEMIKRLQKRIEKQLSTSFFTLRQADPEPRNVIVSFLAILELCKQGEVLLTQKARFTDIAVEPHQPATPKYY